MCVKRWCGDQWARDRDSVMDDRRSPVQVFELVFLNANLIMACFICFQNVIKTITFSLEPFYA